MTVTIPWHRLYWQTVCIECLAALGITGCMYRDGEAVERVWGTASPPRGWKGRRPTPEELLRSVSSAGYVIARRPREPKRIDVRTVLADLWRDGAGEAA